MPAPDLDEHKPPAGSACSCTSITMVLGQVAGLAIGWATGARHGFVPSVAGGLAGLLAGSVAAVLLIGAAGLLAFGAAAVSERLFPGTPLPPRAEPIIPVDEPHSPD